MTTLPIVIVRVVRTIISTRQKIADWYCPNKQDDRDKSQERLRLMNPKRRDTMSEQVAYVGTYTDKESEGIYTYHIDIKDDVTIRSETVTQIGDNPSFLAVHPSGEFLYAVHDVEDGRVTAFRRDTDGSLRRLNQESSGASRPCHCSVHPSGEYLLIAHYTGGAVSTLPIRADGGVAPPAETHRHEGSSVHPERQTQPHPHSITPGPTGRHLYVPDLGTDEIVVYEFDDGALERADAVSIDDGAGPRHLTFHPNEQFAYVINELDSTVTVLERTDRGSLLERGTVSTLPPDYGGENITADIHVHPSGVWVYGSNRNTIPSLCCWLDYSIDASVRWETPSMSLCFSSFHFQNMF